MIWYSLTGRENRYISSMDLIFPSLTKRPSLVTGTLRRSQVMILDENVYLPLLFFVFASSTARAPTTSTSVTSSATKSASTSCSVSHVILKCDSLK